MTIQQLFTVRKHNVENIYSILTKCSTMYNTATIYTPYKHNTANICINIKI